MTLVSLNLRLKDLLGPATRVKKKKKKKKLEEFHGSAFCRIWIIFAEMRPKLGSRCVAAYEFGNTTDLFVCCSESKFDVDEYSERTSVPFDEMSSAT